jgi:hypothetical protein
VTILRPRSPFKATRTPFKIPGLAEKTDQLYETRAEPPAARLKVIVSCDSFSASLAPFLSERFAQIFWIRRPGTPQADFEPALANFVEQEKPDIYIEERLERTIRVLPDVDEVFGGRW